MRWTWDPEKAAKNLKKHGVSFGLAEYALNDPLAISVPDPWIHEERWRTLGMPAIGAAVVLFIVHTWPDNDSVAGRIISARQASPAERRAYEEG